MKLASSAASRLGAELWSVSSKLEDKDGRSMVAEMMARAAALAFDRSGSSSRVPSGQIRIGGEGMEMLLLQYVLLNF